MTIPLTEANEDSGPYSLMFAQSRIEHPTLSAAEYQEHIQQLADARALNPGAEKQRVESYRKHVLGTALRLHTIQGANAVNSQDRLVITDKEKARAERDFRQRFLFTYESERLRLAHYGLTPYDLINETTAYKNVMEPKPLDEEDVEAGIADE